MNKYNIVYVARILLCLTAIFISRQYVYGQQHSAATRLNVQLIRGAFSGAYQLILCESGFDAVNDADALQHSEGFVALAGLAPDGTRLAIDERRTDTAAKVIRLHASGWTSGAYTLKFSPGPTFFVAYSLKLVDDQMQICKEVTPTDTVYTFFTHISKPTWSSSHFSLLLEPRKTWQPARAKNTDAILVYPNPFNASLYISIQQYKQPLSITIRDFTGRKVLDASLTQIQGARELSTQRFAAGPYLVELFDQTTGLRIKSLKIIKQ
jgi:hypothetical protein